MKFLFMLSLLSSLLLSNEDLSLEEDFLQSLDEVSEIATKTKLNIDDSPSFVSVLTQEKLQKLGIDNVYEALAQVPGVQLKRERSGVPVVVFRGVEQKGEVKLMVDGVTINNSYRGSIYYYLDFPIELVERIEVIRGAGSVLYGSGAISGVINIITTSSSKNDTNKLFISGGTYNNYKGGAVLSANIEDVKIALDAYYQDKRVDIDSTDRDLKDYSAGVKINNENFALLARVKRSISGNAYGVLGVRDTSKTNYSNANDSFFTQLAFKNKLGKENNIEVLAGFNQYSQDIESKHPSSSTVNLSYLENSYYAQSDFKSSFLENNELLLGVRLEKSDVKNISQTLNSVNITPLVDKNSSRDSISAYLNDTYTLYDDFDISFGIRYDMYSDVGDAVSPTMGLIYRVNKKLKLKALYTHAFRAPSWVELTSNPVLEAESSISSELGLVYKYNQNNTLRTNFYKTKLENMITQSISRKYIQTEKSAFIGGELEYHYTPTNQLELDLLASYVDAKDSSGNNIADIANVLTSASAIYEFDFGLNIGVLYKYVSSIKRLSNDTREDLKASNIVDTSLTYLLNDITASLIFKDLFDQGTYYALPVKNDFYDGGFNAMAKVSWNF